MASDTRQCVLAAAMALFGVLLVFGSVVAAVENWVGFDKRMDWMMQFFFNSSLADVSKIPNNGLSPFVARSLTVYSAAPHMRVHIFGGVLFLLLGAFQLLSRSRRSPAARRAHRWAGRVALVVAAVSIVHAWASTFSNLDDEVRFFSSAGFALLILPGVPAIGFIALAYYFAVTKQWAKHRAAAIYLYALMWATGPGLRRKCLSSYMI